MGLVRIKCDAVRGQKRVCFEKLLIARYSVRCTEALCLLLFAFSCWLLLL